MKKYMVIGGIWLAVLMTIMTCSSKTSLQYEIHFDSTTQKTYQLKVEMQDAYTELVSGVHEESYILMVLHNLDMFEVSDNVHAKWEKNHLHIIEGDGKGTTITGELVAQSVCMPKVQPRSFLQELFH